MIRLLPSDRGGNNFSELGFANLQKLLIPVSEARGWPGRKKPRREKAGPAPRFLAAPARPLNFREGWTRRGYSPFAPRYPGGRSRYGTFGPRSLGSKTRA